MESFIGTILMFAGNFAPRGWSLCNGQLLSIAQNTALFSLLGTTYGGDGRTTFALPNLQGRVVMHPGQSPGTSVYTLGQSGGVETVTLTANQMPSHTHTAQIAIHASGRADGDSPGGNVLAGAPGGGGPNVFASAPDGSTTMNQGMATATIAPAGASQPTPVVQPFQCVNYIICLEGIYPSRD